jgi:glycosyltransferase involved in cell wall biosynthesis
MKALASRLFMASRRHALPKRKKNTPTPQRFSHPAAPLKQRLRGHRCNTVFFRQAACVRKGVHHLLDAWAQMGGRHKLQFVGAIEPAIAERYRDLLTSDRVEVVGFVDDVHPWFAKADVFVMPSLEEGGPQVTYEAALHGLPIIASPMGACRIGDRDGALLIVEPSRTEDLLQAMTLLADDFDLRAELGREARKRAFGFHWPDVGARRAQLLRETFQTLGR